MASIVVTGVGGGVGQSIIKCLQKSEYEIIGTDGEVLGTGLYAVKRGYKVPYASDPGYTDRLLDICRNNRCSLIFPGLDAELPFLSREVSRFKEIGTTPIVSSPDVVDICDDKLETYRFLVTHGFDAPYTFALSNEFNPASTYPLVLKTKRGGARSRGVYVVRNDREFSRILPDLNKNNYVGQEFIEGDEYTAGSINFHGICHGIIIMKRILRDGDTYKAFVVKDQRIEEYLGKVAETIKPFGPCNFQFRERDGKYYIFDINARCSGTTYCRALAGFNEPLMTADYLNHGKSPKYRIHEVTILRYWKELLLENLEIKSVEDIGYRNGPKILL